MAAQTGSCSREVTAELRLLGKRRLRTANARQADYRSRVGTWSKAGQQETYRHSGFTLETRGHQPGAATPLPGTARSGTVFPTLLYLSFGTHSGPGTNASSGYKGLITAPAPPPPVGGTALGRGDTTQEPTVDSRQRHCLCQCLCPCDDVNIWPLQQPVSVKGGEGTASPSSRPHALGTSETLP